MNFNFEKAELASTKKKRQVEKERLEKMTSRVDTETYPDVDRPLNKLGAMTAERRREIKRAKDALKAREETRKTLNEKIHNLLNRFN